MTLPFYKCDQCGLCCKKLLIEVDCLDVLREPKIADRCVHLDGGKTHPLPILDTMWSLACVKPCPFLDEGNSCSIYPTRPGVCVSFQAGQAKCQELRRAAGLPELQPVPAPDTIVARISAAAVAQEREEDA